VVLRNVLERRGELALLRAVGFTRARLAALVRLEHLLLLAAGLVLGSVAAWLAILPALAAPGSAVPLAGVGTVLAAMVVGGYMSAWLATTVALRGVALDALREE
jgi:ABC-type antimicrobial peptide transport system permease subunit